MKDKMLIRKKHSFFCEVEASKKIERLWITRVYWKQPMLVSEGHVNDTHCTHLHTVKSWCSIGSQHHIMWTSSTYRAEILYHQQNHWAPKLGFVWKCGIKWYKYTLNHTSSILIPSNISNPSIPASNDHFVSPDKLNASFVGNGEVLFAVALWGALDVISRWFWYNLGVVPYFHTWLVVWNMFYFSI